jgi:hypothetical protein
MSLNSKSKEVLTFIYSFYEEMFSPFSFLVNIHAFIIKGIAGIYLQVLQGTHTSFLLICSYFIIIVSCINDRLFNKDVFTIYCD